MKMKIMFGVALLSLCAIIPAFAWDNPYNNDNSRKGNDNSKSGYESSLGNRYQYDLSDPSDRVRYKVDPGAKLRDKIDVDPRRQLERDTGQYGGGVYR